MLNGPINIQYFCEISYDQNYCRNKLTENINEFIKEKDIKKSDIIEFRTNIEQYEDEEGEIEYQRTAELSWWDRNFD